MGRMDPKCFGGGDLLASDREQIRRCGFGFALESAAENYISLHCTWHKICRGGGGGVCKHLLPML